tara:strand:- start:3367 stop:4605 length:1239 start_codon:yes stop_codon:yes gene_type:complete
MGYSQTKIGRLAVIESTWGATADAAGDFAELFAAIDCEPPSLTLTEETLTIDGLRSSFEEPTHLSGSRMNSTMSFKCFLNGWSNGTPGATDDPSLAMGASGTSIHPIGLLFKHALGGHAVAVHAQDMTGGTTSAITHAGADSITNGHAYLLSTVTSGQNGVIWVSGESGGTITPAVNLSAAPDSSVSPNLYAGHVLYLSSGQVSVPLAFQYQGSDANSLVECYDCSVTSLKLSLSPLGPPELDVEIAIGSWVAKAGVIPGAYTNQFPTVKASLGTNGARLMLNGSVQQSVSMECEISCEYANALSHASAQGLAQRVCTNRTTTTSLSIPASTLHTDLAGPGDTKGILQLDLNANTPGNAMSLLVPNTVVRESSPIGDSDGLVSVAYTLGADVYTADTGSTAPADTPFRIAFL